MTNYVLMRNLINKDLKLYEVPDRFLHMKLYYFDDEVFTMGSFNNDRLSWKALYELNLIAEGNEACGKMKKVIDDLKSRSKAVDKNMNIGLYRYWRI